MLKGLSPLLTPDLLWVLASMGHGDDLVIADRNFPAASVAEETVTGKLIEMPGNDIPTVIEAILTLFPLDSFVAAPIRRMEVVGEPDTVLPVHADVTRLAAAAEGQPVVVEGVERFAFYAAAKTAYAVVQCSESRPYGCFILKKGVVFN